MEWMCQYWMDVKKGEGLLAPIKNNLRPGKREREKNKEVMILGGYI